MKTLAQEIRDWIERLESLTVEDPSADDDSGYAAKIRLTRQAAANLPQVTQYLSSPQVGGKLVRHPRMPDALIFLPKDPMMDSDQFITYFEKLTDAMSAQLGFEPFADFSIVAAGPFASLPPLK